MRTEATERRSSAGDSRARRLACVALVGLLGAGVCASGLAQTAVLFAIPTDVQTTRALPADSPWHVALYAADLSFLARALNVPTPPAGAQALDYTLDAYPEISGSTARTWLEDTFVIDYRDHEVATLQAEFHQAQAGRPWARQALTDFVAASMTPSVGHAWEIASQVAHSRNGDCKQYAVLTAALARSAGIPARVAIGLALLEREGQYASFGHAWAETREDGHWAVADAALKKYPGIVRYLPFGILDDEGPGFQLGVMRATPAWVQRVSIIGTP
jgi:transglutaminase-like putative cysteine protease